MSAQLQIVASGLSTILETQVHVASSKDDGYLGLPISVHTLFEATRYHHPTPSRSSVASEHFGHDSFNIFVKKLSGSSAIISVHYEDTISAIKDKVELKERIPANQMRLKYNCKDLSDEKTVAEVGLERDSTIFLLLRLRGGDCSTEKAISALEIDADEFDSRYDFDFTNVRDDSDTFMRGGYEYTRPYGWKRLAVKALGTYENDDWLGPDGIRTHTTQGEWPVAYHGTDMSNAEAILKHGFIPGHRELYGRGTYSSPSVEMVAEHYAPPFRSAGKTYQIVFQNRVNPAPDHLVVIDKSRTGVGADYWLSPQQDIDGGQYDVRPYGILILDQPRSRLIFRDPIDNTQWLTTDSAHFLSHNPIYLACQMHLEGRALPIKKIDGPPIDRRNARSRVYGSSLRSTQLAIQPRNTIGGHSMAGVYLCQVQSISNASIVVNKTLTIHIHDVMCPIPSPLANGKLVTMGTTPGSCLHYECNRGHTLIGSNDRVCLSNGTWTGGSTQSYCVSTYNATCSVPPTDDHTSLTTPTSTTPTTSVLYQIGDTVTYACKEGYVLEGVATRVCLGGNRWDGVGPKCESESENEEDGSDDDDD